MDQWSSGVVEYSLQSKFITPLLQHPNTPLFSHCQRFIEARFAANGGVSMNDAALCSFVDRRDDRADLISAGRRRGTHLLLNCPQLCQNAAIAK